jgi:hypothetical protein
MEKRCSKRNPVNFETEIFFDGIKFPGFIENISYHGLHIIAASKKMVDSFIPEKTINLHFQSFPEEEVKLNCEVRWVHINKTPIHGLMYRMGMELKNHNNTLLLSRLKKHFDCAMASL